MRLRWFPAPDYTWADLIAFISGLDRNSATVRQELGASGEWGIQEQLLALNADYLRILIWMRTEDGQKGRNIPKPIPRPGVDEGKERTKLSGVKRTAVEQAALLGF